jgi:hypothetical protein
VIYEGRIMGEMKVEGRKADENLIDTIGQMMTGTPLEQIQREGVSAHD